MGDASATEPVRAGAEGSDWDLQLSPGGRTTMIVVIVLGVISTILNNSYRR
jgi:hypothetical protein